MTNLQNIINKYGSSFPEYNFPKRERQFAKLSELAEGSVYSIHASLINELRADDEVTQAINEGQLGFETYSYTTDAGRTGYSINIVPTNAPSDDTKGRAFDNAE